MTFLCTSLGIAISGDRIRAGKLYGIFARDPDRTTLEFEKNHGEPENVVVTRDMIGYPQRMDHVGIRVHDPEEVRIEHWIELPCTPSCSKLLLS